MFYENEAANSETESVEGYVMIICADRVRCNFHYPTEPQNRKGRRAIKKLEIGRTIVDERIYTPRRSGREMEHNGWKWWKHLVFCDGDTLGTGHAWYAANRPCQPR